MFNNFYFKAKLPTTTTTKKLRQLEIFNEIKGNIIFNNCILNLNIDMS